MVLWKFTLREIKSRPGRAVLTLLSIVISVAALVAVNMSKNTTEHAYKDIYESVSGRASFEVVAAEKDSFFKSKIPKTLEKAPGVKAAVPLVQDFAKIRFNQFHQTTLVMGIDPSREEVKQDYELKQGEYFPKTDADDAAMMEMGFANSLGVKVGDEIKLSLKNNRNLKVTVCGLLAPRGTSTFNQIGVVFLPLGLASKSCSEIGGINRVSIILDEKADENKVQSDIAALLPPGLQLRVPQARLQMSKDQLKNAEQGLAFAFWLNIFLAIFMIFNTFLMNVSERRRQLSILRAIGTTRKQIIRMLILEGACMGVVGTILGALVGVVGAQLLTAGMTRIYSASVPALLITPGPFVLAAVVGPVVSLFGVIVPAYLAGKITPLEGMRPSIQENNRRIPLSYCILAVSVFLILGSLLTACIVGWLPVILLPIVGVFFTVNWVMLVPIVLRDMTRFSAAVLYPFLGVEGRLAGRQILRRRARATLTIGILYIAVSTAVSVGINIFNNVNDVRSWFTTTMNGDFFIRSTGADASTGPEMLLPESLAGDIRKIDGVENVESIRSYSSKTVNNEPISIGIRDFTDNGPLPLVIKEGNIADVRRGLADGGVVLGTVMANKLGKKVGDEIPLDTPNGMKNFRIVGTATVYLAGGKVGYLEGRQARKLLGLEGASTFIIHADPNQLASVETKLKSFCEEQGLMVHSFADLRNRLESKLNGVTGSLWGLMALGFVMGALGMANTLTMNVLEQTRELALLRVVAMTRRQVRKTILAQAIIIGFIGMLTGTLGGIAGSYTINLCSIPLFGHAADFAIHPMLAVACFVIGMVVILLAALIPAERAARLNLLIALQYE
jgi:putative ABC transport system permease protein